VIPGTMPPGVGTDAHALRKEMLRLRAASERLELADAASQLRDRIEPFAGAARGATRVAQFLAPGRGAAHWLPRAVHVALRHPWAASLLAAGFARLRRGHGALRVGVGLGLGVMAGVAALWLGRRRRAPADGPAADSVGAADANAPSTPGG